MENERYIICFLHDALRVPYNSVSVEIFCGVKPKIELLFSIPYALSVDIGVDYVGFSTEISQELKINLIMVWPFRR